MERQRGRKRRRKKRYLTLDIMATNEKLSSPSTFFYLLFFLMFSVSNGLDNGLGRTPPMGWMSWVRYACETNCSLFPNECINEDLYMEMADSLADLGFRDAGYEYVNIDDCWSELKRDPITKKLLADRKRFPSGIPALSDYIHKKGLKFGIYSDIGTKTCAGYPGHLNDDSTGPKDFFSLDAATFADWKVDSLKVDGCYANTTDYDTLYPALGDALNKTGRPILYACSWPAYVVGEGRRPDYASIAKHCNYWRNFNDIMDSWPSVLEIIDFYAKNQDDFAKYHGPGQWFDPDMIIVGDFGLSLDEARTQFALWSIMSAPLLLSNDLRSLRPEFKEILLNRHVIAVDQDPLGSLGKRVFSEDKKGLEVWAKRLSGGDFSVVYFNRGVLGNPKWVSYELGTILNKITSSHQLRDPVSSYGGEQSRAKIKNAFNTNSSSHFTSQNQQERSTEDSSWSRRRSHDWVDNPVSDSNHEEELADLYYVTDLFDGGKLIDKLRVTDNLTLKVNPSGVRMVRLIPQS